MINREINNLILLCAEVMAFNGEVKFNNISYKMFHESTKIFIDKHKLLDTYHGKIIISNLLKGNANEKFIFDEAHLIIRSLVEIKRSYKKIFDKIFISHSSLDSEIIEKFITLLESIGLNDSHMICSDVPGYGIPLGNNIYDYLKKELDHPDIFVVFMLSDNYYTSVACQNEMGATWVNNHSYQTILLNGFKFKSIEGAIDPCRISFSLTDKFRLNEFKDLIIESLGIDPVSTSRWERARDSFIKGVN